ncbi:MAG: TlpA family protein disulfide reductase [Bacteroidales bacterium]|jgi:thiol-disulfide isomerase/thioredoxin|nr:TlpA family protein disulfide reductase [Bacteroidales bacterium]
MKKCFILSAVVVFFVACGQEKSIQIKGELSGSSGDTVYVQRLGIDARTTKIDTILLDRKGCFAVHYKISHPVFYALTIHNKSVTLLLHPKEKVKVTGDVHHFPFTYNVEGSEDSKNIQRLHFRLEQTKHVEDSINNALQQYVDNRNFVNIRQQFVWDYLREIDSLRAYNIRFINQNPKSLATIYALYQKLSTNEFLFSHEEDLQYFQKADSLFYRRYPEIPHVQMLHNNTLQFTENLRTAKLNNMLYMLGKDAPEIALPSLSGKIEKLSSGKGKYVLLDFWASWSPTSRDYNKILVKAFKKYHAKGFDIYQVSLDQTKGAWEKAVKEDRLIWTNVCDFKYYDSDPVKEYNVENLPANFLIDNEGTIIAKGLRGGELEKRLSEIFADTP